MPEERDELERAWQALTERERLLQQTMARRSGEIDARARRFDEIAAELEARWTELKDEERMHDSASRQLDTRAAELEARTADLAAKEKKLEQAKSEVEPRLAAATTLQRDLEQREQQLVALEARHAEQE